MALNPFFLQGSSTEQFLVQDLINEQLKIYGIDVYYLPRKVINIDNILNEVETSKFDDSFLIEAYLDNYEGYSPGSDIMTKFGLRLKNEINLIISRERFEDFISTFLQGTNFAIEQGSLTGIDPLLANRPSEGDLIYFPLGQRLFEIKRVEHEKPFYQLGKNYIYELQCELYEYENELIDTSIEELDKTVEDEGYITSINLAPVSATDVEAGAIISDGVIGQIILNEDGYGYTSTPTVTISESPGGVFGIDATAVAITTSVGGIQSIESIRIIDGGRSYDVNNPPTVTITGGGGVGASATSVVVNDGLRKILLTNTPIGYYQKPTVSVPNPESGIGKTALVEAIIGNDGSITSFQIINAGFGYTETPTVSVSAASTGFGGTFQYNEKVTGTTSGTIAYVREFDILTEVDSVNPPGVLRVAINDGKFSSGELIVGSESSASYIVTSYNSNSYEESYDSNEEFELEGENILDFTETNPFGEF